MEAADTGPKGVLQAPLGTEGKVVGARTTRRYDEVDRGARELAGKYHLLERATFGRCSRGHRPALILWDLSFQGLA